MWERGRDQDEHRARKSCGDDPLWATHSNPKALFSKLMVTFTGKVSITAAWGTLEGVKQRSFNQGY